MSRIHIKLPKFSLSKSQKAAVGIVGYFVGRTVLDTVQTGHLNSRDLLDAAFAGALSGCRALLPQLSGLFGGNANANAQNGNQAEQAAGAGGQGASGS